MKDASSLRGEIVNRMWNIEQDAKRSPPFHRYLETLIIDDRKHLLNEVLEVLEKQDNYHDCIKALIEFKRTIK